MSARPIMYASEAAREFVRAWEGCRLKPYCDSAGLWTIGVGHLLSELEAHDVPITMDDAEGLFFADSLMAERGVQGATAEIEDLAQNEFDALFSFAYNAGTGALATSTLLRLLKSGDRAGAAAQFERWNEAGGKVDRGLVKRRNAEKNLFLFADYSGQP